MNDHAGELGLLLFLIALVVYLTRIAGYLIGQQFRHIGRLRPVLEALPGCALIALIVPAVYRGSLIELSALVFVVVVMWKWNNIIVASIGGLMILLSARTLTVWAHTFFQQ